MANIEQGDINLIIEARVIQVIQEMRQTKPTDKESGGMLIGSKIAINKNVVIRDYTMPQKGDYQSRYRFIRRKKRHNALLQKKWEDSNRTVMYLGEWHTHPEANPHYSNQDIRNWRRLLRKSKTFSNYIVFIIGGINFYKVWIGNRDSGAIELVHKGAYDEGT